MVEILRRGEKPEDHVYTASCGNCQSLLRFKGSEADYHHDQRDGDYLSVECPVCQREVTAQKQGRTQYQSKLGGWKD